MDDRPDTILIGVLRRPHGVSGAIKVESYSGESEHFRRLENVELVKDGTEVSVNVTSVSVHNGVPVMTFAEFSTPEEVRKYSGWEIRVAKSLAAPTGDGEYYADDLVGSTVLDNEIPIGSVCSVIEGGPAHLLEILLKDDERHRTVLVPFMDEFFGEVRIERKEIELKSRWALDTE